MLARLLKKSPPLYALYCKLLGRGPRERQMGRTLADIERKHVARYEKALAWLRPGDRVLDVACGCGYGSALARTRGAGAVVGADISAEALDHARRHFRPDAAVAYVEADLRGDAWAARAGTEPFDLAISLETLEHLEDPGVYLRVTHGLLRPGGILVVSTPNPETYPLFVDGRSVNPFHCRHWSVEELTELLEASGFRVKTWFGQTETAMVERGARDEARFLLAVAEA